MFQFVFNKNGLEGILILLNVGALFKPEIMKNGCVHLNLAIWKSSTPENLLI